MDKLISKNIVVRLWEEKDLPLYRKWEVGEHKWMDFNGPYHAKPPPERVEAKIGVIQKKIRQANWGPLPKLLVIADRKTDELIGTVSWYWISEDTNWKVIGIAVYDENNWNKGIGCAALKLWVDYIFKEDPSLVRLGLRTWSGNMGMIRLAEKVGFVEEARFRKARIVNDEYYDSVGMGMLREEWEALI